MPSLLLGVPSSGLGVPSLLLGVPSSGLGVPAFPLGGRVSRMAAPSYGADAHVTEAANRSSIHGPRRTECATRSQSIRTRPAGARGQDFATCRRASATVAAALPALPRGCRLRRPPCMHGRRGTHHFLTVQRAKTPKSTKTRPISPDRPRELLRWRRVRHGARTTGEHDETTSSGSTWMRRRWKRCTMRSTSSKNMRASSTRWTPRERQSIAKMGDMSVPFVREAMNEDGAESGHPASQFQPRARGGRPEAAGRVQCPDGPHRPLPRARARHAHGAAQRCNARCAGSVSTQSSATARTRA